MAQFTHRPEASSVARGRFITVFVVTPGFLIAALAIAGCGSGGSGASESSELPKTANGRPATLGVASNSLGRILVDSQGRTLYLFRKDSGAQSACSGDCAVGWPPLRATGKPTVGSGARSAIIMTSARSDGKAQVTYNGHPLYRFSGDQKPGDINGQGVDAFGGFWYAVSPAGDQVTIKAPSSGSAY